MTDMGYNQTSSRININNWIAIKRHFLILIVIVTINRLQIIENKIGIMLFKVKTI